MGFPRILWRYLLGEVCFYAAVAFVGFSTLLVSHNLLRRLDELVAVGVTREDLAAVAGYLLAMLSPYAVPVALVFGVVVTLSRLAGDSEITALRASGIGVRQLVLPLVPLAVAVSAVTAAMLLHYEPRARHELRRVLLEVTSRGNLLEPGRFQGLGQRVVFVRDRDRTGNLRGVIIFDRSNPDRPFSVFAETGSFEFLTSRGTVEIDLQRGDLHLEPLETDDPRYRRIAFERFSYSFDVSALFEGELTRIRPSELDLQGLRTIIRRLRRGEVPEGLRKRDVRLYEAQLHKRLALSLAPSILLLTAVPLSLRRARGARSWGTLVCALLVFGYFLLLTFGERLAQAGTLPAAPALWLPNAVFALLGTVLLARSKRTEL